MDIEEDKQLSKDKQKIKNLESKLEQNRYHVKNSFILLECYNKLMHFDKANALRMRMYKYATFTEQQWIDWITEELTEANEDNEKKKDVIKIFDLALDEGYFPIVAEMYLTFIDSLLEEKIITKQKTKYIMEKVIGIFYQDFSMGSQIFKKCKKIEIKFQKKLAAGLITEKEFKDSQNQLRQLFQRELKVPLVEIQKVWQEYQNWEQDEAQKKKMEEVYNKTFNEQLVFAMDLEDEYTKSKDKMQFMSNLIEKQSQDEKKTIENTKVINFFERCLSSIENARELSFWKLFIQYLKDKETPASQLSKVMCRATKNSTVDLDLHTEYLRVLEKKQTPHEEIESELDRLLHQYKDVHDERYILYTSFLSYTVRNLRTVLNPYEMDASSITDDYINPQNISVMRKAYENAIKYFKKLKDDTVSDENNDSDTAVSIGIYIDELILKQAEIECYIIKDKEQVSQIMEKYLKTTGDNIQSWKKYYEFERVLGKTNSMRGILKRACLYVKDDVLGVHQLLVDFEQDYGTPDLLEKAIQKQIQKYQEIQEKEEKEALELEQTNQTEEEEVEVENNTNHNEVIEVELAQPSHQESGDKIQNTKRKASHDIATEEDSLQKKIKTNQESDQDGTKPTIFVKNLPANSTEASIMKLFENRDHIKAIRVVKSKFGGNKGFAYIDFNTLQEANNACLMMNDALVEGQKLYVALSAPPKKQTGHDNSTAYLSNLPFQITEEEIKQAFPGFEINQVRMIRESSGDFRGFAYVEFCKESDLKDAIETFNKNPFIKKRKIFCDKSEGFAKDRVKGLNSVIKTDEQNNRNKNQHGNDHSDNQYQVFLKNLGFKVRESDIVDFFKDQEIETTVIAKDQETGQPKGFGFVTFKNKQSYDQALRIAKGVLRSREFEIQKYHKTVPGTKKDSEALEVNQIQNKSNDDFKKYFKK